MRTAAFLRERSARRFASFLSGAVLAFLVAEIALRLVSPPVQRREVEDAIRDLRQGNPDILVISSSHGRSFHALGQEVARRTLGKVELIAFPLEAGRMRPMEWVLRNRAVPLLDERDSAGLPKRMRLKHLIFGVTWWDSCRRKPAPDLDYNVVSRAWTWNEYAHDVAVHGITETNRNFLRYRLQRMASFSRLAQVQGIDPLQPLVDKVVVAVSRPAPRPASKEIAPSDAVSPELAKWREDIETGRSCLLSSSELEALERIEAFAKTRHLDFTVVLFPLMPQTVTPVGRLTLERFAELMRERGQTFGYRVVDMTALPIFSDQDFMRDMDHLTTTGNAKFIDWALQHELAFLLNIPGHPFRELKK